MNHLDETSTNEIPVGITTGYKELDRLLGGFKPGSLYILSAHTSVGKSALSLNVSVSAAQQGTIVIYFSLEMPSHQVVQRLQSSISGVDAMKIRTGELSSKEAESIASAQDALNNLELHIVDSPAQTVLEIQEKTQHIRNKKEKGNCFIVIDYLQLLSKADKSQDNPENERIKSLVCDLEELAKRLNVPILVLAQSARRNEVNCRRSPRLSDLRQEGSIVPFADVVMLIDRVGKGMDVQDSERPNFGEAWIHVKKNVGGQLGIAKVKYHSKTCTFQDKESAET